MVLTCLHLAVTLWLDDGPGLPPKAATAPQTQLQRQLTRTRPSGRGPLQQNTNDKLSTWQGHGDSHFHLGLHTWYRAAWALGSTWTWSWNLLVVQVAPALPLAVRQPARQARRQPGHITYDITKRSSTASQSITHIWCHSNLSRDISVVNHTYVMSCGLSREMQHDVICDIDLPVSWVMMSYRIWGDITCFRRISHMTSWPKKLVNGYHTWCHIWYHMW
jgi:hypothetical protein